MPSPLAATLNAALRRLQGDTYAAARAAVHEAATSPWNTRKAPTEAQLRAGNYAKGRASWQGLKVAIENPAGTTRSGVDPDGQAWTSTMQADYGDITGTRGADGDPVDIFLGPFPESDRAWVLNQLNADRSFDEHKVLAGFADAQHALDCYRLSYAEGWDRFQAPIPCTAPQLKWWLRNADTSRPFSLDSLPTETPMLDTATPELTRVFWDSAAEPASGRTLADVLYGLRVHDADEGLLLDSLTMDEILADPEVEQVAVMDALVTMAGRLKPTMTAMMRVMASAGTEVQPLEMQISEPLRRLGGVHVAALFELSDGQTITIWFHNPDMTPAKFGPADNLVSWKWLLNKKDITIVVAPEKGVDLNTREVARRVMKLAQKNSAAFAKANAKRAETMQILADLKAAVPAKQAQLQGLMTEIEAAKSEKATRDGEAEAARAAQIEVLRAEQAAFSEAALLQTQMNDRAGQINALWQQAFPELGDAGTRKTVGDVSVFYSAGDIAAQQHLRLALMPFSRWTIKSVQSVGVDVNDDGSRPVELVAEQIVMAVKADPAYGDQAAQQEAKAAGFEAGKIVGRTNGSSVPKDSEAFRAAVAAYAGQGDLAQWYESGWVDGWDAGNDEIRTPASRGQKSSDLWVKVSANDYRITALNGSEWTVARIGSRGKWLTEAGQSFDDLEAAKLAVEESIAAAARTAAEEAASRATATAGDGPMQQWRVTNTSGYSAVHTAETMVRAIQAGMAEVDYTLPSFSWKAEPLGDAPAAPAAPDVYAFPDASDEAKGLLAIGASKGGQGAYTTAVAIDKAAADLGLKVRWEATDTLPVFDSAAGFGFGLRVVSAGSEKAGFTARKVYTIKRKAGDSFVVENDNGKEVKIPAGPLQYKPNETMMGAVDFSKAKLDDATLDKAGEDPKPEPSGATPQSRKVEVNSFQPGDRVVSLDNNQDYTVTGQLAHMVSVKGSPKALNANRLKLASGARPKRITLDGVDAEEAEDDFDEEAEFDACPSEDDDADMVLDGDFKGHPFRGNQHKKASKQSGSAVSASIKAKRAESKGDTKAATSAHRSAAYAHMAALEDATGKARTYHKKMAKFHGGRGGVKLDDASGGAMLDGAHWSTFTRTVNAARQIMKEAEVSGANKKRVEELIEAGQAKYKERMKAGRADEPLDFGTEVSEIKRILMLDDATGGLFGDGDAGYIVGTLSRNTVPLATVHLREDGLVAFKMSPAFVQDTGYTESELTRLREDLETGWRDDWFTAMGELATSTEDVEPLSDRAAAQAAKFAAEDKANAEALAASVAAENSRSEAIAEAERAGKGKAGFLGAVADRGGDAIKAALARKPVGSFVLVAHYNGQNKYQFAMFSRQMLGKGGRSIDPAGKVGNAQVSGLKDTAAEAYASGIQALMNAGGTVLGMSGQPLGADGSDPGAPASQNAAEDAITIGSVALVPFTKQSARGARVWGVRVVESGKEFNAADGGGSWFKNDTKANMIADLTRAYETSMKLGDKTANENRWRSNFDLPPLAASEASAPAADAPMSKSARAVLGADALLSIKDFLPQGQRQVIAQNMRGEEGEFFIDKMVEMRKVIETMPSTYGQDGKGDQAIAYLHYFKGGADWWITEKDKDGGVDQAFGLADLFGDGGELGYISIRELTQSGVELDLYWTPKTLAAIRGKSDEPNEPEAPAGTTPAAPEATPAPDAGSAGAAATDPGSAGTATAEAAGVAAQRSMDLLTLNRIATGIHPDMLEPELAEQIETILNAYASDAEVQALGERAITAYSNGLMAATN